MRLQPPPDIERKLAEQWRFTLTKVEQARIRAGRQSGQYEQGVAVTLVFVTAIMCAYGFDGDTPLKDAQKYLEDLIRRYP